MPSAKTATKLDISTKCARAGKEPPSEPTLFRALKMMMTPTLMKMESDNPIHLQGLICLKWLIILWPTEENSMRESTSFPIVSHPKGPYNHHIVVRVDTGADVNCMNEKTFNEIFPEVHQMYSRYLVTYGNDSKQYIANVKIQSWNLLSGPPHPPINLHDDSDNKAGKSSTCTHISHAKYFTEWTSSTQCTCPQATTAGSEAQIFSSLKESPASTQWQDFCEQTPIEKARDSVTLLKLL